MRDGVHMRLTLTRGKKVTSGMSPTNNQYGPTLIIIAEWKDPVYNSNGIRLITSAIRRNNPAFLDSKIHHNNLINNILAKIEANFAGVDDALMLDIKRVCRRDKRNECLPSSRTAKCLRHLPMRAFLALRAK